MSIVLAVFPAAFGLAVGSFLNVVIVRVPENLSIIRPPSRCPQCHTELALRDGLTGLYNHRFFQEALTAELARSARHGRKVGLIFIDLDLFKNYNDMLGHPAGHELHGRGQRAREQR